jgi:hypothetical protein
MLYMSVTPDVFLKMNQTLDRFKFIASNITNRLHSNAAVGNQIKEAGSAQPQGCYYLSEAAMGERTSSLCSIYGVAGDNL